MGSGATDARRAWRFGFVGVCAALLVLLTAPAASAHAALLFTTPAADAATPTSPTVIQLVFDQPITLGARPLTVRGADGHAVALDPAKTGEQPQVLAVPVDERLPAGQYSVDWTVTAQDGDTVTGDFNFAVGTVGSLMSSTRTSEITGSSATLALFRWVLFVGLAVAIGGVLMETLLGRGNAAVQRAMPPMRAAAGITCLGAVGVAATVAGAGSFLTGLHAPSSALLTGSRPGIIALTEVTASSVAFLFALFGRRHAAALCLFVVVAGEGARAHPHEYGGALGVVATVIHLGAAAIWLGGLIHVLRVAAACRRAGLPARGVVATYARVTVWLVLAVLLSGVLSGLSIISVTGWWHALTSTTYGGWLLTKLAAVAVILALAASARRHLRGRPTAPQPSPAAAVEGVALVAVLGVSALLTTIAPPVTSAAALPFPPPPHGPVEGVGTRAGFVGVNLTASTGQLLVRLSQPDTSGTPIAGTNQSDFELTAEVAGPHERVTSVSLRRCGYGCFVGPVTWERGTSVLTFHIDSELNGGGTAAADIVWPPVPAPGDLLKVVKAMNRVPALTVFEHVTSNTAMAGAQARALHLGGPEFVAAAPYSAGRATTVTVHAEHDGETVLALAYPASGINVLLTVDRAWRIVRELLTTPKEYVTRTLVYPAHG